jgi:hypothetical protein
MIAFASAIFDTERFRRYAWPGIQRIREPDSVVFAYTSSGTVGRALNVALERAGALGDLEALVIVGESAEMTDPALLATVRRELAGPGVAAVGPVGASGVTSMAWWEADVSAAPVLHRYHEHGGGERTGYSWARPAPPGADVDALDGLLIALSPEAVRSVRFDESMHHGYGADVDLSLQLRDAGHRLRTADIRVTAHLPLKPVRDVDLWAEAHIAFAEKWEGRFPAQREPTTDWRARARRAEAEREAARTVAYSTASRLDARLLESHDLMTAWERTPSWRVTAPLRLLRRALAAQRARKAGPDFMKPDGLAPRRRDED